MEVEAIAAPPKAFDEVSGSRPEMRQAVLQELDAVCSETLFARSPGSVRLLRFLVERDVAGAASSLRETSIGAALYGRDRDYDPKLDGIVRVNANRLRTRLEEYYWKHPPDRIEIILRPGSYVPLYRFLAVTTVEAEEPAQEEHPVRVAGVSVQALVSTPQLGVDNSKLQPAKAFSSDATALPFRTVDTGKRLFLFASLGVLALCTAAGLFWRNHLRHGNPPKSASAVAENAAPEGAAVIRSIAVIPLENLSRDASQQYFADGLTEELISRLSQSAAVRVVSRASSMQFGRANQSSREIAAALGVDALVQGSVFRVGKEVKINAHLVDARSDRNLWSGSYDQNSGGNLAMVDAVCNDVSRHVAEHLNGSNLSRSPRTQGVSEEAYDNYLRGRFLWNQRTFTSLQKSIEYFRRAIADQPNFAVAHAGLAQAYFVAGNWSVLPEDQAQRLTQIEVDASLALDERLAAAHTMRAVLLEKQLQWKRSEEEFRRAIELDPSDATTRQWYGNHLSFMGRHEEAIEQAQLAVRSDPISPMVSVFLGVMYYNAHRYDEAIAVLKRTLEIHPNFAWAAYRLAGAYVGEHQYDEAVQTMRALSGVDKERDPDFLGFDAYVQRAAGNLALADHETLAARRSGDLFSGLYATVLKPDHDEAFQYIDKLRGSGTITNFAVEPMLDPLRGDPRFEAILRSLNLPPTTVALNPAH